MEPRQLLKTGSRYEHTQLASRGPIIKCSEHITSVINEFRICKRGSLDFKIIATPRRDLT